MKIVITGGGTGGHLSVAKAFLEAAFANGIESIFIGSINGQDRAYFENENRFKNKYFLESCGVVNKRGLGIFKAIKAQFRAFLKARKILKDLNPCFVFSVGGYSAAPAAFAAMSLKIPLIIHEQNAKMGRLNSLLKTRAKIFFSSFLENSPVRDYPVGAEFFATARIREQISCLLFLGGSQGARAVNNFALSCASELKTKGLKVLHQCGRGEFSRVCEEYNKIADLKVECILELDSMQSLQNALLKADVLVFGFCKIMPQVMAKADFAISRAGASSLFELSANGLVALFVPFPYAAANHQFFNAKFLEERDLGFLCEERELFFGVLEECLRILSDENYAKLRQISTELQRLGDKNAADSMLKKCIENIKS